MRALIQRVNYARVRINHHEEREIGKGLLVLLGIEVEDDEAELSWLTNKIANLRIFDNEAGIMDRSLIDIGGELMLISQFTLHASTRKGNRPSYIRAARPEQAEPLYLAMKGNLEEAGVNKVVTGEFGAHMAIKLENDGPVSIMIDTMNKE